MTSSRGLPISRRRFLVGAGVTGAALAGAAVGGDLLGAQPGSRPDRAAGPAGKPAGGPLVVIGLYGGNDGLNTLVPYADPAYLSARPTLGYRGDQVLDVGEGLGLNQQLSGLHTLWQRGQLAIVRGVGYPNPNLSHFASMAVWQSANPVDGTGPGWLGRWLDMSGTDPMRAISVGTALPPIVRGAKQSGTAVTGSSITIPGGPAVQEAFTAMQRPAPDRNGLAAAIAGSGADLLTVKGQLDRLRAVSPALGGRPAAAADLAGQLGIVAALINAGAPTRAYHVAVGSFDTHAGEKANHERLLKELDTAVPDFLQAVAGQPAGQQAVVMTYSEFGRRTAENASGGTDHGAASVLFVAGHGVKGGRFFGDQPSLTKLDADGNLVFNVDFRSVYSTVLARVLGADPVGVLGSRFPLLDFV